MLPEKNPRPGSPTFNVKLRPFVTRRILLTCITLILLSLLLHQAYYVRENVLGDVLAAKTSSTDVYQPALNEFGQPLEESEQSDLDEPVLEFETQFDYEERGAFTPFRIYGFDNTGAPGGEYIGKNLSCSSLSHSANVGVQESFFLHDNLMEIAADLDKHPMIDYRPTVGRIDQDRYPLSKIVLDSWDRLATACVFMSDYGVYLCVSRVIYHPGGSKDVCRISFLRGQIFSESWIHLDRYRLKWKDQEIVFPKIFDTETEYDIGGSLYGPEDARIIIEEGVEGAEPVVVFNMISSQSDWRRAIWVFRPFSQRSHILTVRDTERAQTEKNWAPFFVRDIDEDQSSTAKRQPSNYIHFVWRFEPLTVLKCHLVSGMCDVVFQQTVLDELRSVHDDHDASLRGGTQLVPVPMSHQHPGSFGSPGVQAFAAFPRTHSENAGGCGMAVYRPELAVLVTNTTHFYLTYGSKVIDFGAGMVMDDETIVDVCTRGRIMITNSIARWDMNAHDARGVQTDVITLTLSVDDSTVQVLRLSGIWDLLKSLPSLTGYFEQTSVNGVAEFPAIEHAEDAWQDERIRAVDSFERANAAAWDVRACLEESVLEYVRHSSDLHNKNNERHDREKQDLKTKIIQEEEQRKKEEEEKKIKLADEEKRIKEEEEQKKKVEQEDQKRKEKEKEQKKTDKELEEKKAKQKEKEEKLTKEKKPVADKGDEGIPNKGPKRPEYDDEEEVKETAVKDEFDPKSVEDTVDNTWDEVEKVEPKYDPDARENWGEELY
ncbi:Beta-mannosyltransferase 1 [Exophiala xenobiotica]|uniref:Beta-mannosyltransferase 1 n=1 Tax=Vermiconidia calcicola TaxID=1690605 RepID=A0AAV9PRX6_9PEZI|nr:Beta-mannosyltransferase 1 [Exophiala xenobiotica]KAK5528225.1 Beta-mannosyltransferase 1 [Vermiconidia calcicola]KAK5532156.1 Beta-mannosyltransferase 1 [Chaetothyriales sp. CCFEE 6169]KAK5214345.1 Beta-mannosyltransferase 1 [Exophiala xenobiotica]KAK5226896.1 Beta-mannosyltransferase 1 [Exophiala xenobiotica]